MRSRVIDGANNLERYLNVFASFKLRTDAIRENIGLKTDISIIMINWLERCLLNNNNFDQILII